MIAEKVLTKIYTLANKECMKCIYPVLIAIVKISLVIIRIIYGRVWNKKKLKLPTFLFSNENCKEH